MARPCPYAEKIDYKDTKDLTENFILFRRPRRDLLKSGFNRGTRLDAHLLPFGPYPNNAIVGGSAPRERPGLFKHQRKPGISSRTLAANDPVWEAMNFARPMDQFRSLCGARRTVATTDPCSRFFSGFYGMGSQTFGTMGYESRAHGPRPASHAHHGCDFPKEEDPRGGPRPRPHGHHHLPLLGHFAVGCRTKGKRVELWGLQVDCIKEYSNLLISNGLTTQDRRLRPRRASGPPQALDRRRGNAARRGCRLRHVLQRGRSKGPSMTNRPRGQPACPGPEGCVPRR